MNKKLFLFLLPLLLFLILSPRAALSASASGVQLWFHTVLPALLPFIILSNLLVNTGTLFPALKKADRICHLLSGFSASGCYVLLLGFFCGFPMGANLCAVLMRRKCLSPSEARRLLQVSNQISPLFLQGYIASLLPSSRLLLPILGSYYGAALLLLLFSRIGNGLEEKNAGDLCQPQKKEVSLSLGEQMDTSIMHGFEIITRLGGYIILFSVYAALLRTVTGGFPLLASLFSLSLEISSGSALLLRSGISGPLQLVMLAAGLSFGGISTIIQTASVIRGSGLSLGPYVKAKLLQAGFSALLALFFFAVV